MSPPKSHRNADPDFLRQARSIDGLVKNITPRLHISNKGDEDLIFQLQALQGRIAAFIQQWQAAPSEETATMLDRGGTTLWNCSRKLKQDAGDDETARQLIALARGVAALLLYAGVPTPYSLEDALRLLDVLSKAASALVSGAEQTFLETAEELLTHAAQIHSTVKALSQGQLSREYLSVCQTHLLAKVSFAQATKNSAVADFSLHSAFEEGFHHYDLMTASMVHQLCQACVLYGENLLNDGLKADTVPTMAEKVLLRATDWLRKGLKLLERAEQGSLPQFVELQLRALRRLCRGFFELGSIETGNTNSKEALASAEAALDELVTFYRKGSSSGGCESQLVVLRMDILHRREAPLRAILETIEMLCADPNLTADIVNRILAIVRARGGQLEFVRETVKLLLQRLVQQSSSSPKEDSITRVLVTLALVCKSAVSVPVLREMLDFLEQVSFDIPLDGGLAIQMLCWRHGEGQQNRPNEPDHLLAASFYEMAMHPMFKKMDKNVARTSRKVALCYLEAGRPEAAQRALHACPAHLADDALNHYINFDIAARLSREEDAFAALQALLGAPNFRSIMLTTVVQVAQEARFERIVYHALRSIAEQAQVDSTIGREVDAVILTRSLVKHSLPTDGLSYDQVIAESVIENLENNLTALKKRAELDPSDARACKEAEWSYKTAFNAALLMCDRVDGLTAAKAFDIALAITRCRESLTALPIDKEIHSTKLWSSLPSVVARSAVARRGEVDERQRRALWLQCREGAKDAWSMLEEVRSMSSSGDAESSAEWTLMVLEYETFVNLDAWDEASTSLERALKNQRAPVKVLETMADIAWGSKSCTTRHLQEVLIAAIEKMKCESNQEADVCRLARWLRGLLSSLLYDSKQEQVGGPGSGSASVGYPTALSHLESISHRLTSDWDFSQMYPLDEKAWLLSTAWDAGIELYHLGEHVLAKGFCEVAISLGQREACAPNTLQQMNVQYAAFLSRLDG